MRDLLLLVLQQALEACGKARKALDLARHDDLRRLPVGGLFKGFERLELDDLIVGVRAVEQLDGVRQRGLHLHDGLGLAFSAQHSGLTLGLGVEDGGLLLGVRLEDGGLLFALGDEDLALLLTLGLQNGLAALALGLHLLFHGVLDFLGRQNVLQLHAVDLDAPGVGRFVKDGAHLGVDDVAAGEGLVELHFADDVAERRGGEVLDGVHRVLDAVGVELGVGDLKIDDRVDLHGDVILGDDGLGIEVGDLLLEADFLDHALNEGDLQVQADVPGRAVRAETLDDVGAGLLHDVDVAHNENEHEHDEHDDADVVENGCDRHITVPPFLF